MERLDLFDGFYRGKKVLITGSTGFKGTWLSIWLLELGATVYGYSLSPKTMMDNFVLCDIDSKIDQIVADIRDYEKLKSAIERIKPDLIFHCAAQPLVLESYNDPRYTFETNVMGTVNLLEACKNSRIARVVINVTSDKCYDNKEWVWGYRENDPIGGKDPYSASKACSELVTKSYINSFFNDNEIMVATVRAGNVIGAGDWSDNRIIPDFFKALQNCQPLIVRNPDSTRPWQHVLEPLSGYLMLAAKLYTDRSYVGSWNFGPSEIKGYPVSYLINGMLKYTPPVKIICNDVASDSMEAKYLKLDISKAARVLGWKPRLSIEESIKYTAEGYLSDLDKSGSYNNRVNTINQYVEKFRRIL